MWYQKNNACHRTRFARRPLVTLGMLRECERHGVGGVRALVVGGPCGEEWGCWSQRDLILSYMGFCLEKIYKV
jgi:hypothetical protein